MRMLYDSTIIDHKKEARERTKEKMNKQTDKKVRFLSSTLLLLFLLCSIALFFLPSITPYIFLFLPVFLVASGMCIGIIYVSSRRVFFLFPILTTLLPSIVSFILVLITSNSLYFALSVFSYFLAVVYTRTTHVVISTSMGIGATLVLATNADSLLLLTSQLMLFTFSLLCVIQTKRQALELEEEMIELEEQLASETYQNLVFGKEKDREDEQEEKEQNLLSIIKPYKKEKESMS